MAGSLCILSWVATTSTSAILGRAAKCFQSVKQTASSRLKSFFILLSLFGLASATPTI